MLCLKAANTADIEAEYDFVTHQPADENGFTNQYTGCSFEEFRDTILPGFIDHAQGRNLPEGYVPGTEYFLWDDGQNTGTQNCNTGECAEKQIVGLFRLRPQLNDFLRQYHGHIGYGIRADMRGRGYGTEGLRLLINIAREVIDEDEIYLSVHRDNPASLAVQLKNGAYIVRADEECYYTRIPMDRERAPHYRFFGWERAYIAPVICHDEGNATGKSGGYTDFTPRRLYDILSKIWCADTCAPRMRAAWTPENKTLGQCSVTAFLVQDIFGGEVYGVPLGDGNFHCYNVVGDCVFDLTSEQFDVQPEYGIRREPDGSLNITDPEQLREVHFAKEEKHARYELLKSQVLSETGTQDLCARYDSRAE